MNRSQDPNVESSSSEEQDRTREAEAAESAEEFAEPLEPTLTAPDLDSGPTSPVTPDAAEPAEGPQTREEAAESSSLSPNELADEEAARAARVDELQAEVERLRREAEANRERWLRAVAELENTRKRFKRDLESSINLASANLLRDLLDVVDNFERALVSVEAEEEPSATAVRRGIRLIYGQFMDVLRQSGLSRIEARGEPFDPNLHEALSQKETDEVPSHSVVEVVQEGYLLHDKVLRPARVIVAA